MLLRSRLGCPGRRRSAAQRLLLLIPCLWLWSAVSYASSSLIVSAVVDLAAVGRSSSSSSDGGSDYATGPVAAATIALCCCAGCTISASAILAALLRLRRDTERSWHRAVLHWLTTGAGGTAKVDCCTASSRRDDAASARCTPAPRLVLNLLALALCQAAVMLCELIAMTSASSCSGCSATVSVEPLAAATLQAVLADVADAAVATATAVGTAGEPLTSAALLGLPLASYGAAALLSGDERWRWTWLESNDSRGGGGGVGLVLVGIATIARLARNFLLRVAYGRLDAAAAATAAAANGSESPAAVARLSLFAAMNAAACLWLLPATVALRAASGDQWRFAAGLHPGAVAAATLLSGVGSMLSLLIMLPELTLAEHATARLVKNMLVALAYAATANDEALGSREAAAFMLVAVGVVVFVAGGSYSERGSAGALSNRHLQTPQCILAAICFAALLFNQGAVNRTTTIVVHSSNLESGPCEGGRIPSAAAAVATSLTNAKAAPAILPSSDTAILPLSSEADSIELPRLQPVAPRNGTALVVGNTQSPLPHEATSSQLLPDILSDDPATVARLSNELRTVDALVAEARRLLDTLLGSLLAGRRRAVLVNLFWWPNKGDHLITVAELRLLERHNITIVQACSFPAVNCRFERVPRGSDLVILLQGGGYSGHPEHQGAFNNVIRSFPDQRVVLLPNSLCYPTAPCGAAPLATFARSLLNHNDFHVLLRDAYSYETTRRAVDELVDSDYRVGGGGGPWLYLSPDVAWAVESLVVNVAPVYDIVWLKRNDWESVDSDPMPPIPQDLRVQIIDWVDSWMGQEGANYWEHLQLRALSGVAFLSRGRVTISDRLHAHIMSQLMRKPNVLINSKTQKQGHYYTTWERGIETSRLAINNSEALALAQELLRRHGGPVTLPQIDPV